jgi:undecaprenyl-diphosphatase
MNLDQSIVHGLNTWFAASGTRTDLAKALAIWPLFAVAAFAVMAWILDWGTGPDRRAALLLGVAGAVLALIGNAVLGHFYYRPRPFVAMSNVHLLISHSKETSMYSDHLAAVGGITAGILAARRWWLGGLAFLASVAIAIGRVGAALHYPSDVAAGFAAGVVGTLILLPLRRFVAAPVRWLAGMERRVYRRRGVVESG